MLDFYIHPVRWFLRCLLLTCLLTALATASLLAQTIRYVKPIASGSGNGSSWTNASANLQAMINASVSGDQVWVAGGTYKPTSTTTRTISFAMKNGVAIYGGFAGTEAALNQRPAINATTPSSSTLSGEIGSPSSTTDNSYHVISNSTSLSLTNSAILDGFVVTRGNATDGGGLNSLGGGVLNNGQGSVCSPLIRYCTFVANQAGYGGAICNYGNGGSSSPVLTNCVFQSNTAINGGAMVNDGNDGSSSPLLTNCTFQANRAVYQGEGLPAITRGGGMFNDGRSGSSSPVLTNCSFQGNSASQGGVMYNLGSSGSSSPVLTNCVLWNNGGNSTFGNSTATVTISYSLFEASVIGYVSGGGNLTTNTNPFASTTSTQLAPTSPAINAGDPATTPTTGAPANVGNFDLGGNSRFVGGRIDIGAYEVCTSATRLYVRASATGANTGLSWTDAFTNLQSALNYYCSGSLREIWVAAGTYKPTSTTDRTISFAMRSEVAIYGGFVGSETNYNQRPAINAITPSSTTLSGDIGAVGNTTDNSYHVISNPPGLTTSAILDGFVITAGNANDGNVPNNYGYGGGMLNYGRGSGQVCSPRIRQCVFVANQASFGGAISNDGSVSGSSSPLLSNCVFLSNTATYGGGVMYNLGSTVGGNTPWLNTCAFQDNMANYGAAMVNDGQGGSSSPQLSNCSFQGNRATNGGAIYNLGSPSGSSSAVLTNCVLWNNGGVKTFFNDSNASVSASYSLFDTSVTGYTSGPGSLTTTTSPFASPTSTQLAPTSPAINTGDPNSAALLGATDLGGNPRFAQGRIDMGAFEWATTCQGLVTSIKAGNWNDQTVWACNVVPVSTDIVQLNHVVTLPASYTAQIKTLRKSTTGKVTYQSGAKLRLGF
ncbi:hypothetical protein IC229_28690 [Spirosoma sp. BT702]|uniref:Right-handed parallel beta-helix repeat-containing protein n=1 Tax=Spirosoma profusum TaxID=2771354 RepID=A0A926Y138_9BACT|nr:choice-of-anchor Q domain-containing protein [Spirosoma profusum]MBD2704649.1 hypothetical protein [Spirosoma profusum]